MAESSVQRQIIVEPVVVKPASAGQSSLLQRQIKTALDETRLLILGAQILLGFQFVGTFQDLFVTLPPLVRALHVLALVSMVVCAGFLIAPSMQHRIVEEGCESTRILRVARSMAEIALVLFALSLGIAHFDTLQRLLGAPLAALAGAGFVLAAMLLWFVPVWLNRAERRKDMSASLIEHDTPLVTRIDQMMTEARVVLPGAQALLGFQFTVTLIRAFDTLPVYQQAAHVVALALVALAVILLMTPAAIHRVALAGHDTEGFLRLGSRFVVGATLPLAAGISIDLYVAVSRAVGELTAYWLAGTVFLILCMLWYVIPFTIRWSQIKADRLQSASPQRERRTSQGN